MNELTRVDVWMQGTLAGDATLKTLVGDPARVYSDVADPHAIDPYIVHTNLATTDVAGVGPNRIMISGLWLVKAVRTTSNWTDLAAIADRIDTLLQGNHGGAAGSDGQVFSCVRERPYRFVENLDGGDTIRQLGGQYRIEAQVP